MTVSHDALLLAVQVQPVAAVTATEPLPAPAAVETLVGETAYVQLEAGETGGAVGAAACETVTVLPPMVSVAERAAPVLAAIA